MVIKEVQVENFRALKDFSFQLAPKVTAIAGQNGTLKSTLLGIMAQPFSLKDPGNPMKSELTIDGRLFESKFKDKFKISEKFDKAGLHKWTLKMSTEIYSKEYFTCISISRKEREKETIRFWSDEGREKGMGYIQCPVIFLSLRRLSPIGEELINNINNSPLDGHEVALFTEYHNSILCLQDEIESIDKIDIKGKSTLAPNTKTYDSLTISSGQDSIGRIIMAVLSFRRLKEKYGEDYKGGILFIDEIDATLFPAAQDILVKYLFKFSRDYKIQIIFTTHSLTIINKMLSKEYTNDGMLVYLRKRSSGILKDINPPYELIENDLKVMTSSKKQTPNKLRVYFEDEEALLFSKFLLKFYKSKLDFMSGISLGCKEYIGLLDRKIPEFTQNIIVLDGDSIKTQQQKNIVENSKNTLLLPGENQSPEAVLYSFLNSFSDEDAFWDTNIGGYTKQICFKDYNKTPRDRYEYKNWFKSQKHNWGRSCSKLFNRWSIDNQDKVNKFIGDFKNVYYEITGIRL